MFHYPASNTVQEQRQYFNMPVKSMSIDFGRSYALNFVKHLPALGIAPLFWRLFLTDNTTLHNISHLFSAFFPRFKQADLISGRSSSHLKDLPWKISLRSSTHTSRSNSRMSVRSEPLERMLAAVAGCLPSSLHCTSLPRLQKKNALRKFSKRFLKVGDYLFSRAVSS